MVCKFRFGDLMFHHKLGWQTSDQHDKAVSFEVSILLVLTSLLQQGLGGEWNLCSGVLLHCKGLNGAQNKRELGYWTQG